MVIKVQQNEIHRSFSIDGRVAGSDDYHLSWGLECFFCLADSRTHTFLQPLEGNSIRQPIGMILLSLQQVMRRTGAKRTSLCQKDTFGNYQCKHDNQNHEGGSNHMGDRLQHGMMVQVKDLRLQYFLIGGMISLMRRRRRIQKNGRKTRITGTNRIKEKEVL